MAPLGGDIPCTSHVLPGAFLDPLSQQQQAPGTGRSRRRPFFSFRSQAVQCDIDRTHSITVTMIIRNLSTTAKLQAAIFVLLALAVTVQASIGDKLPEFKECIKICEEQNCANGNSKIPFHHRLLLWDCPSECDYTCQHTITHLRLSILPSTHPRRIVQFHGKWPFHRIFGMQEPFSVLFSLFNFLGHYNGLKKVQKAIPRSYKLRKYYEWLAYFGLVSWTASMIFHTRDFTCTEQADYFAAGASVLYGLYYTPIRVFRLDKGGEKTQSLLRIWTATCILLFIAHVTYLKWYSWDYGYNMAANVVVGIIQNAMWTYFSIRRYRESHRVWAAWPGVVVAWVIVAMSLELLDFPPIGGYLDAHALWHLGTVFPTVLFYNFLVRDAQDDMASHRLKA